MLFAQYQKLVNKNFKAFICMWLALACSPLLLNTFYEYTQSRNMQFMSQEQAFGAGVLLFLVLVISISTSIWSAFHKGLAYKQRFILLLFAYLMVWLAFGNFFYLCCALHNLLVVTEGSFAPEGIVVLQGLQDFWAMAPAASRQITLQSVNRLNNYIGCLYYSAAVITTIGFGDITPITAMARIFTIIEAFLGQLITVVAVGLWFKE